MSSPTCQSINASSTPSNLHPLQKADLMAHKDLPGTQTIQIVTSYKLLVIKVHILLLGTLIRFASQSENWPQL